MKFAPSLIKQEEWFKLFTTQYIHTLEERAYGSETSQKCHTIATVQVATKVN
jgi:hypothetical protein